jgi:hypothetical protein
VRVVRLVAGVTKRARKVIRGSHLRKIAGFGGILLMATDAKSGYIGERRLCSDRVTAVGVRGLRPVARLAGNVGVLTRSPSLSLIGMAKDALRLSGKGHGPCADQVQGGRPVVAVPAKALGDHGLADEQENHQPGHQDQRGAHQMTGIPEESAHMPTVVHGRGQYYRDFAG